MLQILGFEPFNDPHDLQCLFRPVLRRFVTQIQQGIFKTFVAALEKSVARQEIEACDQHHGFHSDEFVQALDRSFAAIPYLYEEPNHPVVPTDGVNFGLGRVFNTEAGHITGPNSGYKPTLQRQPRAYLQAPTLSALGVGPLYSDSQHMVEPKVGSLFGVQVGQPGIIGSEAPKAMLGIQDGLGECLMGAVAFEKQIDLSCDLVGREIVLGERGDTRGLGEGEAHQRLCGAGVKAMGGWTRVTPDRALDDQLERTIPATTNAGGRFQGSGMGIVSVEVIVYGHQLDASTSRWTPKPHQDKAGTVSGLG